MNKLNYIVLYLFAIAIVWQGCKKDESEESEKTGSIYGVVTDKATGEPIKNAGVELKNLGSKTVTGSEGQFEFNDVKVGSYTLYITKTGYTDFTSSTITVTGGKQTKTDIQIEKLPAALRIVDDDGNDISEIDFGDQESIVARSFNIFNDGTSTLNWQISKTADWITSFNLESGTLSAGATQGVIVMIDRSKLINGENTTTLHITSNDGNRQLTAKATRLGDIATLKASSVTSNSAILKGYINNNITFEEKGFYFGTTANTSTKYSVSGSSYGEYSYHKLDLVESTTYYYRAYFVNENFETIYGEVMSFKTLPPTILCEGCGPGGVDLLVAIADAGEYTWGPNDITTGANNQSDGMINMNILRALDPDLSDYPAAQACANMGEEWYLPSKNELARLYENRNIIGGFSYYGIYWSSTESSHSSVWVQDFCYGYQHGNYSKTNNNCVRPVRRADQ